MSAGFLRARTRLAVVHNLPCPPAHHAAGSCSEGRAAKRSSHTVPMRKRAATVNTSSANACCAHPQLLFSLLLLLLLLLLADGAGSCCCGSGGGGGGDGIADGSGLRMAACLRVEAHRRWDVRQLRHTRMIAPTLAQRMCLLRKQNHRNEARNPASRESVCTEECPSH